MVAYELTVGDSGEDFGLVYVSCFFVQLQLRNCTKNTRLK